MAETVDQEKSQANRAWTHLIAELAIRTPPKLQQVNALAKSIRGAAGAKRPGRR